MYSTTSLIAEMTVIVILHFQFINIPCNLNAKVSYGSRQRENYLKFVNEKREPQRYYLRNKRISSLVEFFMKF